MKRTRGALTALAMTAALAAPAQAEMKFMGLTAEEMIDAAFVEDVRGWIETPVVQIAVANQNARRGDLPQEEIDRLDAQWRAERGTDDQPLITSVLSNPVSSYLTRIQANSLGLFPEIFVTDSQGLNVGQSVVTGDYWQGDEAKFQKTYGVGPGAVFLDAPELNEATKSWRSQLNLTLHDETGLAIGHATVEVNLTELARRHRFLGN
ncbi:MAG: hypothetical protein RIB45_00015 [Marivibrio sp.]|uniref:hypothetical protein n=1 Tax=Marivibrio sp. TaxID=2039719 RepID=UPI0032F04DDD